MFAVEVDFSGADIADDVDVKLVFDRVEALVASLPARLLLAGSAYLGVGLPDCIRQGRDAAQRALALLREPVIA